MNSVCVVGNLATEVELKQVSEKRVASFLLAIDRAGGRDAGADFVWISAWERQGELCAEYLGKGNRVGIEGRLKSRTWEQDGRRRDAIEVVARRVDFLGGGPRREDDPRIAEGDPVYGPGVGGSAADASSHAEVIPFEPAAV